ncbi:hypothetical protein [Paractinoplanes maris]|uniref:hypothetical protein n=1 Tax=Paractinoplanes maris TaxID=1734446 RepID=UPI0020200C59|nr:hypothetical protein [Actinoplanes maris]
MERILYVLPALAGVAVIVANKQFAQSSARSSREVFGRDVGPREAAFQAIFSRVLAVVVGAALVVMGLLGAFGVIWDE